jgi:hypothetical protein
LYTTIADLTELDILRAIFTLIFVIISIIVGIKILLKYFENKNKEVITVGFAWIFVSSPWWALSINFITIILFNYQLDPELQLLFMVGFIVPAFIFWIYSFSVLAYPEKKNIIFLPYFLICIILEILFIAFLFSDYNLIAAYEGGFTYRRTLFTTLFQLFILVSFVITGIIFGIKSIRLEPPEIKWKGRFFLLAIASFFIGSALEVFSTGNLVLQLVNRIILSFSAISYYFSFFLPSKLADRLIKE